MSYVDLRPDRIRPVQVRTTDGTWVTGDLEAYQQRDGVWEGYVRYTTAPSQTYLGWFAQERIRSAAVPDLDTLGDSSDRQNRDPDNREDRSQSA